MSSPKVPIPSTKSRHSSTAKKTRVIRRRGRAARTLDSDSDEEIRREVITDSESEHSSLSSDEGSSDEDEVSTPELHTNEKPTVKEEAKAGDQGTPFFASTNSWSDMVNDETKHGSADLPVIDFADFDAQEMPNKPTSPRVDTTKVTQQNSPHSKNGKPPTPTATQNKEPLPSRKPSNQTARQAYQQRLESDPSYVPKVGQFWGHDDRLLDKNLRSLSGWWRGRWQGRGARGRGTGYSRNNNARPPVNTSTPAVDGKQQELSPADKPWTHDGYEELKQSEEQRRSAAHNHRGGRGGPKPYRGRGGKNNANPNREQRWVKRLDPQTVTDLKTGSQDSVAIRVKLPGNRGQIVRADSLAGTPVDGTPRTSANNLAPESDDKASVVHIPNGKQKAAKPAAPPTPPSDIEKVKSIDRPASRAEGVSNVQPQPSPPQTGVEAPSLPSQDAFTLPDAVEQLHQLQPSPKDDPQRRAQTESAILRNQSSEAPSSEVKPPLPPLQTVFPPPVQQPTPPYGSPYQYAPQLPPGIAVDSNGYPYEVSSGRPVYLPPPPAPMYNPRPMMHGEMVPPTMPYTHSRHQSTVSSDFFAAHSPSPPINNIVDPVTGVPIFSLPRRQSHRVEIRAPGMPPQPQNSTSLRSTASPFEPGSSSHNSNDIATYHPGGYPPEGYHYAADPSGMAYPPYPQHYYYPEGYTEGYPYAAPAPYMDHNGTIYYHH